MTQVVDVPLLVLFHEVDLVEAVLDAAADLRVESSGVGSTAYQAPHAIDATTSSPPLLDGANTVSQVVIAVARRGPNGLEIKKETTHDVV